MNPKDVYRVYKRLKDLAIVSHALRFYNASIAYIKAAGWWAYTFNIAFRDEQLEDLIVRLSTKIKRKDYASNPDSFVFVDSYANDHHGLTQQYIRAIMAQGVHLIYITDASSDSKVSKGIYKELLTYPKASIVNIPNKRRLSGLRRAQFIYDKIAVASPSKVFMHIAPNAVETLLALQALPDSSIRYQINLTDHTFGLGAKTLDYTLEFRSWGYMVSEKERGIDKSRLLLCPYYPIVETTPFKGFPFEKKSECCIFSGGTPYKFTDKNHTFFKIIKRILDENPSAVWVHAGDDIGGIKKMALSVMDENYLKRIYFLGYRDDIGEVFNHIDIYLNSYPVEGGLMSLYAARYGKPILSLLGEEDTSTNELVGQLQPVSVVSNTIDELCAEANRLITDTEYRNQRGKQLKESTIDERQFNALFNKLCTSNVNVLPIPNIHKQVELPSMEAKCLMETEDAGCRMTIVGYLKWRGIFIPHCLLQTIQYYPRKIQSIINRNIKTRII